MKKYLSFLCFTFSSLLCTAQTDSLNYLKNLETLKQDLTVLRAAQEDAKLKINTALDKIEIDKTTKDNKVDSLSKKIAARENLQSQLEFLQLKERYSFGLRAINEMEKGVTLITFMQEILQLQQEINNITNIWSDNDIRNGYDKVGDVLTIVGPLIAGGLIATNNISSDQQKAFAGGGISLVAVGQLLKKLFGKETAKKYEFIDMTRKSYDNLVILNQKLTQFIESNNTLETRLSTFKNKYEKNQLTLTEKKLRKEEANRDLMEVIGFIDEYQIVLSQIPLYIYELKGILLTYSFHFYKEDDKLIQTIDLLKDKAAKVESKYITKVKPLLQVTPELKTSIYGI